MLTSKAIVEHTIKFKNPDRIPIWVDGPNIGESDVLTYDLSLSNLDPEKRKLSDWGFRRLRTREGNWVVPPEGTLTNWKQVDAYKFPPLDLPRRFSRVGLAAKVCGDRYRLATMGLSGYAIYCALRGVKTCYDDCLRDSDRFEEFFEKILVYETEMFSAIARKGFHGIEFCDDWGPRKTSRITLSLWRVLFKEYYRKQIARAKEESLQVWFSIPSECLEFLDDLQELGVDVVRIENPESLEIAELGRQHRNKICFATRVDKFYNPKDLDASYENINNLRECLGVLTGGFIATVADNVPQDHIHGIRKIVSQFKNA